MRFAMAAILTITTGVAATTAAPALTPAPFEGAWMSCDTYQGAEICEYKMLAQRGNRVCGVQRYFATNAYYEQRFVGTVKANVAHIEKICGDPGSETDTYCAEQAPADAAKVGWGSSDRQLTLCKGRLLTGEKGEVSSCTRASAREGLKKVSQLDGEGPEPEDRAWMVSCLKDEDR